jgi:hypothetical protein
MLIAALLCTAGVETKQIRVGRRVNKFVNFIEIHQNLMDLVPPDFKIGYLLFMDLKYLKK